MDRAFASEFLKKTHFPEAAVSFLNTMFDRASDELDALTAAFCTDYDYRALTPAIEAAAERTAYSKHSLWLGVLVLASQTAIPRYRNGSYFWQTFEDLRYKALECVQMHGVWGVFVPVWYPRFFRGEIVTLGRLQYDLQPWYGSNPIVYRDVVIRPGDRVIYLHIPASGEPFDREARLASYRMATEYFGGPLVCLCDSWLLYPPYEAVFPKTSNIADFRREFHICQVNELEKFTLWSIVGPTYTEPPENWPQDTSLQRAFKTYVQQGGTFGSGVGLFLFDGETVTTASDC